MKEDTTVKPEGLILISESHMVDGVLTPVSCPLTSTHVEVGFLDEEERKNYIPELGTQCTRILPSLERQNCIPLNCVLLPHSIWMVLFSSKLHDSNLSGFKRQVEEGVLPYPIFAAIDDDLQDDWREKKVQSKQKIGAEWRWQGNGRH